MLNGVADENGEITAIKVEQPDDFATQMLKYAEEYHNLPVEEPVMEEEK